MMRKLVSVVLILGLGGCLDLPNQDYTSGSGPTEIKEMDSPGTATVGTPISFQIRISGPNGCWKRLKASMVTVDSKHLRFDGTGIYESNGTCPAGVILKDTLIKYTPTLVGKIYLQSNLDPFPLLKDSLMVTN